MTRLILASLALAASLLQVGALSVLFPAPAAAPVLPVAVLAAWGALRGADELWAGLLLASLPLGLVSEERLGWFLLALLPTAALMLQPASPDAQRRFLRASLAGAGGALTYLVLLFLAAGEAGAIPAEAHALLGSAALTAVLAGLFAALLWPLRVPRSAGLFR